MKLLILLAACLALASAAPHLRKPSRDLSKYQDRRVLYPHLSRKARTPAPPSKGNKITGGNLAARHQFPHQVGIFIDDLYFCGGSIISEEWVLTAAHCADAAGFFEIIAGAQNIREEEDTWEVNICTEYAVHENWISVIILNDVAVIQVPQPYVWSEAVMPVRLATTEVAIGTDVTASGWGRPSDADPSISPELRHVTVPVMTNDECNAVYGIVSQGNICVDTTGGMSTCNGDSGGPLTTMEDGMYVSHGVTSFGASAGCEVGFPAAFSRVSFFFDWIQTNCMNCANQN